jgi:hypothetical protein
MYDNRYRCCAYSFLGYRDRIFYIWMKIGLPIEMISVNKGLAQ